MEVKPHEPTLAEYNLDISVYKSYREQLSGLNEKLANLEKKKEKLHNHEILSYGTAFVLTILVLANSEGFQKDFWVSIIASIFVAIVPSLLLQAVFETDFLTNILSFGKLNKLKKLSEDIKEQIEELKREAYKKVQPFETAASEYYQSQLREFFETKLYKKKSGNQQFEEALSEFSSMIDELSTMNSVFITTGISYWNLREYKEYLKKRTINHRKRVRVLARFVDLLDVFPSLKSKNEKR